MMSNQGFGDFDRLRHRSPSPMASSNIMSNVTGAGLGGWNGLPPEVIIFMLQLAYPMFIHIFLVSKIAATLRYKSPYTSVFLNRCCEVFSLCTDRMLWGF